MDITRIKVIFSFHACEMCRLIAFVQNICVSLWLLRLIRIHLLISLTQCAVSKAMLEEERRKNATVKHELSQMRRMNAEALSSPRGTASSKAPSTQTNTAPVVLEGTSALRIILNPGKRHP